MTATSTDDGLGLDTEGSSTTTLPADRPSAPSTALVPIQPAPPHGAPAVPGAGLIAEAESAIQERRWRDALRVLDAIDSIGASSVHTDGLVAVAATHLHKSKAAREAVGRIRASTQTDETRRSLAAVAIARHEYVAADRELRAVFDVDGGDHEPLEADDWADLASIYSGLGWFDEAGECLDHAEAMGASGRHRWSVGRSINHWAMSRSWGLQVGALLFVLGFGLLSVAIGLTVPFMMREFRLTQLDERMAAIANDAWSDERWLRLAHAAGVLVAVVCWAVVGAVA